MNKKTGFITIEELYEYVNEVVSGNVPLSHDEILELRQYINWDVLIRPNDRKKLNILLDGINQ